MQTPEGSVDSIFTNNEIYRLKNGDNLYVDIVTSNEDFRNYITSSRSGSTMGAMNSAALYLVSYQVDENGFIHLPFIDSVNVKNKTLLEVREDLIKAFSVYVTDVNVNVKLVNFNVTVLGEVFRPGQHFATSDQLNLYGAIGLAGDLTLYGNRKNVKVMRLMPDGKYQIRELDITQASVIADEFFVLQPNDVVYVEPLKTKPFGFGTFPAATILSTITTLIVIISLFKK
jgi:polysaccharide export outer membrane protein